MRTNTVLIVDDDARNRAVVQACLEGSCRLREARDGSECLEIIRTERVDLVILDVMMPGVDGFETCRRIKALAAPFLPVLLLTALHNQEARNEGLTAGADDFLTKPIDRRELQLRVDAFIRLREQDRSLRQQKELIARQFDELHELQALKDDLIALIVHDLKNPLTAIAGFLELVLARQDTPPSIRQHLETAGRAAGVMKGLLEQVLEVRRLEEAEVPLRRERVVVAEFLRDAARAVDGAAGVRQVSVEVEAPEALEFLLDPGLARRALDNLVGNALRFAPAGSSIHVRAAAAPGQLTFEITDRGPGVPDSTKVRLFRKFARVEDRGAARQGFGLGLYLVKLVAVAHGGNVFVRDNPCGGSVFGFTLREPLTKDPLTVSD
jgi:signal transduction histidine kinase